MVRHALSFGLGLAAALLVACHAGAPPEAEPMAAPSAPAPPPPAGDPTVPAPPARPEPTSDPKPAPSPPARPEPTSDPKPAPSPPAPPPPAPAPLGGKCGDADACPAGQECVSYRGIAGARGPLFKTCEIKCDTDAACPAGHRCRTIADGPGRVCR